MQKDLLYCAIDVSKDKLDLNAAELGNDQAGFRQLIKAAKKISWRCAICFRSHRALPPGAGPGAVGSKNPSERSQSGPSASF
jgi:hypothetical protein